MCFNVIDFYKKLGSNSNYQGADSWPREQHNPASILFIIIHVKQHFTEKEKVFSNTYC